MQKLKGAGKMKRLRRLLPQASIVIDTKGEHGITQYGGGVAGFLRAERVDETLC